MNLANNLRKIRKENNLSQEQLAEKLGVSRQSVSKWESEQAYPEMEKMVQICELFDITMDELLNQNVSEVNQRKEEKATLAKYIDSFLSYVTKTIDLFSSMKWSQRIKCLFEQCVFGAIIALACFIAGSLLKNILRVFSVSYRIVEFFGAVYVAACVILGFALLFQIFKVRYLNYYEIVREPEQTVKEKTEPEKNDPEEAEPEQLEDATSQPMAAKMRGRKKEKIIIRDPDHSEYKFISGLVKCFLMMVKIFAWIFGIGVCGLLVATVCGMVMLFMIAKSGLLFVGVFLVAAATAAILSIILVAVYSFIFNRKHRRIKFAISFLCSVIVIGAGLGLSFIGASNFDTPNINDTDQQAIFVTDTIDELDADKQFIDNKHGIYDLYYVPVESDTVKIEIKHPDYIKCRPDLVVDNEDRYNYFVVYEDVGFKEVRNIIRTVNNRIIPTFSGNLIKISVYASQQNIDKIKENQRQYAEIEKKREAERQAKYEEYEVYEDDDFELTIEDADGVRTTQLDPGTQAWIETDTTAEDAQGKLELTVEDATGAYTTEVDPGTHTSIETETTTVVRTDAAAAETVTQTTAPRQ